jgi:molecular chaperone DnaK
MNIVGIDLGTTFCAISQIGVNGKAEIVLFSNGKNLLPSCVMVLDNDVLVGIPAQEAYEKNPDRYFELIKRYMGDEYFPQELNGEKVKPSYLSSLLLKYIKEDYENRYGKIDKCIVTVPAYFDESRRSATLEAIRLAGLPADTGLLNEPTAAGLYYASRFEEIKGKSLIFDLGGGTFDVTILDIVRNNGNIDVNVISSQGDHELGGKDFDKKLLEYLKEKFSDAVSDDVFYDDITYLEQLMNVEETVKKKLSEKEEVSPKFFGANGTIFKESINRETFESLIDSEIQKVKMLVEGLLNESNIDPSSIENILLVGGSSRIPYFQKYLTDLFNKEPKMLGNVDESVALGAAISSMLRAGVSTSDNIRLQDVCNHSYGTFVFDQILNKTFNDIIIPKNSSIPITIKKVYGLISDGQSSIDASVTQGESSEKDEVNVLQDGNIDLSGFDTKAGEEVVVEFSYDINQTMKCVFTHSKSGKKIEVNLQNS